ncbi:hypothetical protein G3480_01640 [Thiorhodococcus mannitoliphagus]|uniref:Uncharacterized protein n=1 Tax=Thiorhodococcus mannitoliphagus TaxID=329406 RepID=A0A6P1DM86_9GAMM|nr:hypothetical protein [Thiorhodococcus mannitoliphagus]NEX19029.1 hypothetical protein [Thiorhodococcus mannitoliphagus]
MTRPGFGEGVLVALGAALLATVTETGLSLLLPSADVAQLLCMGIGLGYGLYLLARSAERVGRVVVVLGWVAISLTVAGLSGGLGLQLLTQLVLVWLTRVLYHHAEPMAALLDLGLLLLGFAAALWALERTGSLFLTVWTLLLVQALFPLIPSRSDWSRRDDPSEDAFAVAERAAERALQRLSVRH